MGQNFVFDPTKQPFHFAGQKVSSIKFVCGGQWTQIGLNGAYVDKDGCVVVGLTPAGARAIAADLKANADKDQVKQFHERIKT